MAGIITLASCDKDPVQPAEVPVSKTVQFVIAQGADYSSPVFDGVKAELKLSVARGTLADGKTTVVWDTTFSLRDIRTYPTPTQALVLSRGVDKVYESKEVVYISRVIRYVDAANQTAQDAKFESIPTFDRLKIVPVNL